MSEQVAAHAGKQVIAVDIDDVLAQNAAGFVRYSNQRWGTELALEDYDEDWTKVWGLDMHDVEKRADVLLREAPMNFEAFEDALPVLQRLSHDYILLAVTSRRSWMRQDTIDWLNRHYRDVFTDQTLHFAGIWDEQVTTERILRTKANIINELGADYLIDDQPKHCIAVAKTGIQSLLFGDYKWNQTGILPQGVTRVSD